MKKDDSFVQYVVEDLLGYMGDVYAKRMFGGSGVYRSGMMFGIIDDDTLYIKVNKENKKDEEMYRSLGGEPFVYYKNDKPYTMSYFSVTEDTLENRELLAELVDRACEAAMSKRKGR